MADALRNLQARVAMMRPDLTDGIVDYWLQETTRRIGRETALFKELQVPVVLPAATDTLTITPANGNNIHRIERIRIAAQLFTNAHYVGTWNASTNTPSITTGSASSSNSGYFYIVSVAGTTTVDGTSTWNVGDIIQSSGALWQRYERESMRTINELNKVTVDQNWNYPQDPMGGIYAWGQTIENPTGTLYLYPRPQYDTAIEVLLSYTPINELTDIGTLPIEVQDAIVHGTLGQILMLPSNKPGMQNLQLSEEYRQKFEMDLANLKTKGLYGFGGSSVAIAPAFTGGTWPKTYWSRR